MKVEIEKETGKETGKETEKHLKLFKCFICNRKLNILCKELYKCKCELILCREKHLYNHNCIYNYHNQEKAKLEKNLKIIRMDKVNSI